MKRIIVGILILFIFSCDSSTTKRFHKNLEWVEVLYTIDGDTIKVMYQGKKESVRLIGIDTPESRRNKRARKQVERTGHDLETIIAMGKESKKFLEDILDNNKKVGLEFDVEKRERSHWEYKRLLAYVYTEGGVMINEYLVREGYATVATYPPNVKYEYLFISAQRYARENKAGHWK